MILEYTVSAVVLKLEQGEVGLGVTGRTTRPLGPQLQSIVFPPVSDCP